MRGTLACASSRLGGVACNGGINVKKAHADQGYRVGAGQRKGEQSKQRNVYDGKQHREQLMLGLEHVHIGLRGEALSIGALSGTRSGRSSDLFDHFGAATRPHMR